MQIALLVFAGSPSKVKKPSQPTASVATTTLMQAVKDLPGTPAGIVGPRGSLSAASDRPENRPGHTVGFHLNLAGNISF